MTAPQPLRDAALALALALALPAAAGCSGAQRAESSAPRTARDYFPLRTNAAWSFDSVDVDRGTSSLVVMRVIREENGTLFYMNQGGRGAPAAYEYANGAVSRNGEVILQDPIAAGTRWRGRGGDAYVIRSVGLTRTVTAGTFRDVIEVVRTAGDATLRDGTEYRETYYYAPGVGPIEAMVPVMVGPGDARRFRLTLRGYTLTGDF